MKIILASAPWLEVLVRSLYWRNSRINSFLQRIRKRKKSVKTQDSSLLLTKEQFLKDLKYLGIKKGDTILVHSSSSELSAYDISPEEALSSLIEVVGDTGNIIMPAIPILRGQPRGIDRFDLSNYASPVVYNVRRSKIWTGALPSALSKRKGAVKSRSPLNTMVALGRDAEVLINNAGLTEDSLPCGKGSPLANLLDYDAKILCIGVREVHSMTFIHVAEDLYENQWPIKTWYWKRKFRIIDGEEQIDIELKERDPLWSLFYAEYKFEKDLFRSKIVKTCNSSPINLSVTDSKEILNFLRSKKGTYPFYIPFWIK